VETGRKTASSSVLELTDELNWWITRRRLLLGVGTPPGSHYLQLVHVHLQEHSLGELLGVLDEQWRDEAAGAAPGGREVNDHLKKVAQVENGTKSTTHQRTNQLHPGEKAETELVYRNTALEF
jgi:hypothetical protein